MKPIKILSIYGIIIMLLFFTQFLFYAHYKEKRRIRYVLLLFGSFLLALCNRKSCFFFLVFGLYFIAYYLKDYKKNALILSFSRKKIFSCFVFFLLFGGITFSFYKHIQMPKKNYFEEAVNQVLEEYDASSIRAYVNYNFGGYTEYRGIPSYLDPRAEVFYYAMNHQDDVIGEFYDLQNGVLNMEEFLDKYQFTHLFITRLDYLSTLDTIPHYTLYYENSFVTVYVHEDFLK